MIKLCECGCGTIVKNKFARGHGNWKGGKMTHGKGYIGIREKNHPRSVNGYVREHILIAEEVLGKSLPPKVVCHHVNGITGDNRNENLVICENEAYHNLLHRRERALKSCGHASWRKCSYCKKHDDPENMYIHLNGNPSWHRDCRNEYRRVLNL